MIRPEPGPRMPDPTDPRGYCPYDTHSVDLSLGDEIVDPGARDLHLRPLAAGTPGAVLARNSRRVKLYPETAFPLKPNQFILAQTREYVSLPLEHLENTETCLAARIEGKSSRARVGLLIHFTAPTVHPDFSGTLTLEMINLGPASVLLRPGMPIAQLIVEEVKGIPRFNPSQFQGDDAGRDYRPRVNNPEEGTAKVPASRSTPGYSSASVANRGIAGPAFPGVRRSRVCGLSLFEPETVDRCCGMRARSFSPGSSVGSWDTRRPSTARFRMP